jgi:lipopolysaccharide export system permease protein
LIKLQHALAAFHKEGNWVLQNVTTTVFSRGKVNSYKTAELAWPTALSPDLLNVVAVEPRTLSLIGLYQYIEYLKKNGLISESYEQAFWSKITVPFVTCIMMLLAIPFVFGPLRSVGVGSRMLVGALVGIGFHLLNETSSYVGLVYHLDPIVSVCAPPALALVAAIVLLRRVY